MIKLNADQLYKGYRRISVWKGTTFIGQVIIDLYNAPFDYDKHEPLGYLFLVA